MKTLPTTAHFPTSEHQTCSCGARKSPPLPPCTRCDGPDGVTFADGDSYSLHPICAPCWLALYRMPS